MKKIGCKRCLAVIFAVLLALALSGCDQNATNASKYVKTALELQCFGNVDDYAKYVDITAQQAQNLYEQDIKSVVSSFTAIVGIEELSDSAQAQFVELFKEIYRHCDFEVGTATPVREGSKIYNLEITVKPVNLISLAGDELIALYHNTTNTNDDSYVEGVLKILLKHLPNIGNEEAQVIKAQVQMSVGGVFYMDSENAQKVTNALVNYSAVLSTE